MLIIGLEHETLRNSLVGFDTCEETLNIDRQVMMLNGLGLFTAGCEDPETDKFCCRWLINTLETQWPNIGSLSSSRRQYPTQFGKVTSMYSIHQACHTAMGLNHIGQGRMRLIELDSVSPEYLSLLLASSIPVGHPENLADNR
eukprot:Blabericola_migrator_1__742@NODE_1184_length_5189_cov_182_323702_g63_i1_p4_GENE_NODE_1184_length_5189_cov_182_323702_g63_i1NODE_1184_length_5189_cov_182_323702_g63_i1_p4_ORF_typecomplete_len143_score20_52_NODE_1184_length_5189_cov_182_323702_g63_i113301758